MKVGDYVRTKYGIAKIIDIGEITRICLSSDITYQDKQYILDVSIIPNYDTNCNYCYDYDIIKSSPNIIDLIEVGDYVNGYYVEDITSIYDNEEEIKTLHLASGSNYFQPDINDKQDIKSIVTKECFESMEYKVGK